jgi:hypothetical protein
VQQRLYQVRHLVIGPQGAVSGETIRKGVPEPETIDLAFDRDGNLHALINDEHLMLKDGAWAGGLRTPWGAAGIKPFYHRGFVRGAPDLTWTFWMHASDLQLPNRVDWRTNAKLPYPESVDYEKQVVVAEETPYQHWFVLNMETGEHTYVVNIAADRQNALHAFYTLVNANGYVEIQGVHAMRYAVFRANGACPDVESSPSAAPVVV